MRVNARGEGGPELGNPARGAQRSGAEGSQYRPRRKLNGRPAGSPRGAARQPSGRKPSSTNNARSSISNHHRRPAASTAARGAASPVPRALGGGCAMKPDCQSGRASTGSRAGGPGGKGQTSSRPRVWQMPAARDSAVGSSACSSRRTKVTRDTGERWHSSRAPGTPPLPQRDSV